MRALLALSVEIGASFILYGLQLDKEDRPLLRRSAIAIANAALETLVITRCLPQTVPAVTRYIPTPLVLAEHLELLPAQTAVVATREQAALVSWLKG